MNYGRYFVGIVSVFVALLFSLLLLPWTKTPSAIITMAVVFSAWYGGLGPALLSAFLASLARYFIFEALGWSPLEDVINLGVFAMAAVLIGMLFNERHRTEQELLKQREWLRVTLSSIGDAVIATDGNCYITFLNSAAERITGWSLAEAAGQPLHYIFNTIHEKTRALSYNPVAEALTSGRVTTGYGDTSLLARNGREIPIEQTAAPIKDSSGTTLGAVIVFHDVSQSREAEKQRSELLARTKEAQVMAESASRAKDEFLAVVSHELRTPLTAMLGWARLLRTKALEPEKEQRAIEIIENNAVTQSKLIEDLLDVSRIISGKLILDMRTVDFRSVIEGAFEAVRPSAEAKGIRLECVTRDSCPPVAGDPDRLRQIIYNLLANAIKFTPRGGRVTVCLDRRAENAVVTVTDTGVGIDPEFLPYVFERFRQENSTSTRRFKGLGLGLAIVRHLVELHGGTVTAESAGKEKGSTFTVRIPGLREAASANTRNSRARASEDRALEGLRVLVVEDELDTCELVEHILEQRGADVEGAHSAHEAVEKFSEFKPTVVISDIGMPDEDGYSLLRRIRALSSSSGGDVPAIALTAFSRNEDRVRALACGFQAHLAKPVDADALLTEIARVAPRLS